jgi:hypothetical protein
VSVIGSALSVLGVCIVLAAVALAVVARREDGPNTPAFRSLRARQADERAALHAQHLAQRAALSAHPIPEETRP